MNCAMRAGILPWFEPYFGVNLAKIILYAYEFIPSLNVPSGTLKQQQQIAKILLTPPYNFIRDKNSKKIVLCC
jgi:hypothetical protein